MRVFLPTYRRATLLPRAVASLRAQTATDWICELHNDDPADPFPAELVRRLADPRIQLLQHERNLGPIETFNHFYRPTAEPFYALLEDDNTWEPAFLETLLATLSAHPHATLAWCNQRVIREAPDGRLQETGTFANPFEPATTAPRLQPWGQLRQVMGALHANGAMLLRSRPGETFVTPRIPFGCVEAFRERLFPHPLVYVPQPLATFTLTAQTARRHDLHEWSAALVALAATYMKHACFDAAGLARLCAHFREQRPPMVNELIAAALICPEARPLLQHLRTRDWLRFARSSARHPLTLLNTLRVRTRHPDWWALLDHPTAARFTEKGSNPNVCGTLPVATSHPDIVAGPAPFPVTLQISLAPGDHRLAAQLLNHQVAFWRRGVDEILLTIDTRRSRGRFGEDWQTGRQRILEIAGKIPGARVLEVDYSREAKHAVSAEFFAGAPIPPKDCRGGPYYAYFFGLHAARHDFVLHADSDMFFGGDGLRWLDAALSLYTAQPALLFLAPLPGPPAPDSRLKQLGAPREQIAGLDGYRFAEMSTRLFLFNRARFRERLTALQPRPPARRARLLALLDGHPAQELPEKLFTEAMDRHGLKRFDFAGPAPGCWSLHPPYRCTDFYDKLPALIARIEKSDLPASQLGDHDFNASLVDWSEALARMKQRRWWHRLRQRFFAPS